jgi:endonuclease/exonuclease/phosphatase family metal-dependent hydrolase
VNLLTWNIQAGIGTSRYRDYLLRAHLQLVHAPSKTVTLQSIAREIAPYDVVCLQEVDLGGRRAGYRSQVDEIALMSGHAHVAVQENRTIPGISRHGNAILSHRPLANIVDLKLPGRIAGRGCLIADIASERPLRIACLHLSLGLADQQLQLAAVAEALGGAPAWAAMGDFNCGARSTPLETFCELTGGRLSRIAPLTFPSWRPRQDFDHVVIGGELEVTRYQAEPATFSDHLAISTRLAF